MDEPIDFKLHTRCPAIDEPHKGIDLLKVLRLEPAPAAEREARRPVEFKED